MYVARSGIHGKGLFAGCSIPEGSYVGFYEGSQTLEDGIYVLWVQQDIEREMADQWLGYNGSSDLRYLNHCTQANCEMDGQMLYAATDISEDEELTIDYGEWFEGA